MAYSPVAHQWFFGSGFVRDYQERPMLVIGKDKWTRVDLAKMGVTQMKACSILTSVAKQIGVGSLKEMYRTTSPYTFSDFPAGNTTLFVLWAAFDDHDLNAEGWFGHGKKHAQSTFTALKNRELKARKREREDLKKRQRRQQRDAHEAAVKAAS